MKSNYKVINASAGSGKTYILVQKFLMICLLHPKKPDIIRHILALTFTNKAANEMKERILQWLGKFVSESYMSCEELLNIQKKFKEQGIDITINELHIRAKDILDYILHHYSNLNIGTIDNFNTKIIKFFSYELGLNQNFNLKIQAEPYLIEAVDKLLNKVGEDEHFSDTFMDFVEYNLDNEKRVALSSELYSYAKEFVKDIHYKRLLENKNFRWQAYKEIKNTLREDIQNIRKDSIKLVQESINIYKSKNLEIEDFAGGKKNSIAKFFNDVNDFFNKKREYFPLAKSETSALEVFEKGASSGKSRDKKEEILNILCPLLTNRGLIIKNYISLQTKEKILQSLLPLLINKNIQDELQNIEQEKDLVLLSKFNILINENLKDEPSAFIYEKVGVRYLHYFFDEFQDTSYLQWQNFLPLRDHTISSDQTSFTLVGDPKQSIYRFRGGDSKIMLNIINGEENTSVIAQKETLSDNYRSAKNIVKFNNELYQYISADEKFPKEYQKMFGQDAQQNPKSTIDGRVRVNLVENTTKTEFYQSVVSNMTTNIQSCLDNGFSFSDICILCRGNSDIFNYSQLLGKEKVTYQGEQVFIKTISEKGLTLNMSKTLNAVISFLRWMVTPKNYGNLVMMMYHLNELGRISMVDFSSEILEILEQENQGQIFALLEKKYKISLSCTNLIKINLYSFIEYFVNEFLVNEKEVDFVTNFLELIYSYTSHAGVTIKDFLKYWDEEGANISVQASENVDAIQIMTIHKAKGLEFPVVLLPMENKSKDSKFSDWYELQEKEGGDDLVSVNISGFTPSTATYDEKLQKFNEKNINKNIIDRICVQYVATTRPVEQLFLYLQKPSKSNNHLEIYEFVDQKNTENLDSFDMFETNEAQLKKQKKKENKIYKSIKINYLHNRVDQNFSNITIATPSKSYQNRNKSVRMGNLIHDIFAKIDYSKDIEKVLQQYLLLGIINEEEQEEIRTKISNIVNHPVYSIYFDEKLEKIINEREILIGSESEGYSFYRPDRIVKIDDGYVIIDFKTGKENEHKYKKQMKNYQTILEKLGLKVIRTLIIYLN